jgi:hypothetical protein
MESSRHRSPERDHLRLLDLVCGFRLKDRVPSPIPRCYLLKVFYAVADSSGPETLHEGDAEAPDHLRIIAERSHADGGVALLADDVQHRRKVPMYADGGELGSGGFRDVEGRVR